MAKVRSDMPLRFKVFLGLGCVIFFVILVKRCKQRSPVAITPSQIVRPLPAPLPPEVLKQIEVETKRLYQLEVERQSQTK
jgi:hypothetical protein